jgi:hypothetical protein
MPKPYVAWWRVLAVMALFWVLMVVATLRGATDLPDPTLTQALWLALSLVLTMVGPVWSAYAAVDRLSERSGPTIAAVLALVLAWTVLLHPWLQWLGFSQGGAQNLLNIGSTVGLALAIRGAWRGLRAKQALRELERLRDLAEQRAVQAQLSPHALHNLLNTLYAVSLATPERVPGLILTLSDMMRYLAVSAGRDHSSAAEEWQFMVGCRDFAIERSAVGSRVEMLLVGDDEERVPTLVLSTLLENALKYGHDADGRLEVSAHLEIHPSGLRFRVDNAVSVMAVPGLGLGHAVLRRRLSHLYPQRHRFKAGLEGGRYRVDLELW